MIWWLHQQDTMKPTGECVYYLMTIHRFQVQAHIADSVQEYQSIQEMYMHSLENGTNVITTNTNLTTARTEIRNKLTKYGIYFWNDDDIFTLVRRAQTSQVHLKAVVV